jgi:hypothetical protein
MGAGNDKGYGGYGKKKEINMAMEGSTQVQMQQIANVFYNLVSMIGKKNNDERLLGLSTDMRDIVQSKTFKNLFDNNVPYAGFKDKINLLRVMDIDERDRDDLI